MRLNPGILISCAFFISCSSSNGETKSDAGEPDWTHFRSTGALDDQFSGTEGYQPTEGKFEFRDLKNESDASLANRLLGAVGARVAFVDRRRDRWQYYRNDRDAIESVAMYTRPEAWGSAFGICRSEKYEITFSDSGLVESVNVTPRFGVEGPIFQKADFNWDYFEGKMCQAVPANHGPSYFPSKDVLAAQDLAILLGKAIDLAGKVGPSPFKLTCPTAAGRQCEPRVRPFLAGMKLSEIDDVSQINCSGEPKEDCFTVTVGENRIGPFPKRITIKGSTYLNQWKVYTVEVRESFTMS